MEPSDKREDTEEVLPPPPSEPVKKAMKAKRVPMSRCGFGSRGQKIQLFTNHFKVGVSNTSAHFFHYSVSLSVCLSSHGVSLFLFLSL